jgi:hypothetical protein
MRPSAACGPALFALGLSFALLGGTAAAQDTSAKPTSPPGHGKPTHPGGGPPVTQVGTPTPATVSLSSWLDDASPLGQGTTWLAVGVAEWNSDAGREVEAPIVSVATGLAPRVSVGVSMPVYYFQDSSGATQNGVGDVPLFAKIVLMDPGGGSHRVGVALTPLVDVSSEAAADGASRVTWAVPVSIEVRMKNARVYGSGGYYSSGAAFGTGALEVTVAPRVRITATLGESYATEVDAAAAGASRHRTDISATAAVLVSRTAAFFGAVGHAFSGTPTVDGGPWIAGGLSMRLGRR